MKRNMKASLNAAKGNKDHIALRNKALAIRKCFMRSALPGERTSRSKTDTEVDCQDKIDATKAKDDKSVHSRLFKENTNSPKGKLEACENEPQPPKQGNLKKNNADDQEAGPSSAWSCNVTSNPMKLVIKKAGPTRPKEEKKPHQTEKYEPTEWDYLEEVSRLPLDAPIPDPDLSFLEK